MKEWFKFRTIWGAAFLSLSTTEAGRLIKGVCQNVMTGEQPNLIGAEKSIFAMIAETLKQDEEEENRKGERVCRGEQ